ncbi:MAG TPA: lytic transglycosylase domain-containing protein [Longimicrobiales bacterium]|nr:lytic transglycosylase domain-containing protein [Longimicrobiales bacterium]
MPLRRRSTDQPRPRTGVIEDLERFVRRVRALPLILPVLLFGGWGLGKITARGIALPADADFRIAAAAHTPAAQLESLSAFMGLMREDGRDTEEYVLLYRNHVRPVEQSLLAWGVEDELARRVAWPLVENAYKRGLDPATVVAIVLVESSGRPGATSFVGARGLMQVMPLHQGEWRGCGEDLYDIENNLCYGTSILAWLLRRFGNDERRALLAYNGCVRGTNTPDCHTYPAKVAGIRERVRKEWRDVVPETYESIRVGSAAAP